MLQKLCEHNRTHGWICSERLPFIPLCQERVNICFELVVLLVGCKGKAPAWEGVRLELCSCSPGCWMFLLELVGSRVRIIWRGVLSLESSCVAQCPRILPSVVSPCCHSRAECSSGRSWNLQLQVVLQLTHTLSCHLLQEKSESRFISPESHFNFS